MNPMKNTLFFFLEYKDQQQFFDPFRPDFAKEAWGRIAICLKQDEQYQTLVETEWNLATFIELLCDQFQHMIQPLRYKDYMPLAHEHIEQFVDRVIDEIDAQHHISQSIKDQEIRNLAQSRTNLRSAFDGARFPVMYISTNHGYGEVFMRDMGTNKEWVYQIDLPKSARYWYQELSTFLDVWERNAYAEPGFTRIQELRTHLESSGMNT